MNKSTTTTIEDIPIDIVKDILRDWIRASEVSTSWNSILLRTKECILNRNLDSVYEELQSVSTHHKCSYYHMSDCSNNLCENTYELDLTYEQYGYEGCLYDLYN